MTYKDHSMKCDCIKEAVAEYDYLLEQDNLYSASIVRVGKSTDYDNNDILLVWVTKHDT